ncbi:unnamed protein product, partial [Ixodes pacificus]
VVSVNTLHGWSGLVGLHPGDLSDSWGSLVGCHSWSSLIYLGNSRSSLVGSDSWSGLVGVHPGNGWSSLVGSNGWGGVVGVNTGDSWSSLVRGHSGGGVVGVNPRDSWGSGDGSDGWSGVVRSGYSAGHGWRGHCVARGSKAAQGGGISTEAIAGADGMVGVSVVHSSKGTGSQGQDKTGTE